jgi:hypothetical protein
VWFADEARVGQKNKITRRWARRGTIVQPAFWKFWVDVLKRSGGQS